MRGMKWIKKMVMEMVLILTMVLMETLKGGMEEPSRGDLAVLPPSNPLRRQPSDSLFCGFVFLRRLFAKFLGDSFYSRF